MLYISDMVILFHRIPLNRPTFYIYLLRGSFINDVTSPQISSFQPPFGLRHVCLASVVYASAFLNSIFLNLFLVTWDFAFIIMLLLMFLLLLAVMVSKVRLHFGFGAPGATA